MEFRHYAIALKAIDEDQRLLTGTATNNEPDRDGDVFDPQGAEFTLPLPLLWHHQPDRPIGEVFYARPSAKAIEIRARVQKVTEPGPLKDFLDFAWQNLKHGLVKGLSIGYRGLEVLPIPQSRGLNFKRWLWVELSTVTIPANAGATIASIKSADARLLAASGTGSRVPSPPGVPGSSRGTTMNVSEQITARRAELQIKNLRLEELMTAAEALSAEQDDERATLTAEVKGLAATVESFQALQSGQLAMAKAIQADNPLAASNSRHPYAASSEAPRVEVREIKLPPGVPFARVVLCKMAAYLSHQRGEGKNAYDFARERYPDHQVLQLALKAAIPPALTTTSTWAGALVYAETLTSDFLEYLRPQTIVGQFGQGGIPPLRGVPFNSRIVGQDSGGTGYWVGQAKPKPLTKFDFSAQTLDFAKVAAITPISEEVARFSNPSAEQLVRDGLTGALRQVIDETFIDPAASAVANVSPASITNGVTPLAPSGTNADAVRADMATIIGAYLANNQSVRALVLIMPPSLALVLSMMRNALGQQEFTGITMNGGNLEGLPVIVSEIAANASGSGNLVIAVNTRDVALADDGGVSIDVSREAALEMKDSSFTQDGAVGTGVALVSLWQNNLLGIKAERFITWKKLRSTAVVYMDDVGWGGAGSPA